MKTTKLQTFIFVRDNKILSPTLTTIREYGSWLPSIFDEYTCQYELYLKATKDNVSCMEYHPGTRIGNWFDKRQFSRSELYSWFVLQDSTIMEKLKKWKLAEYRDTIPISVNDEQHRKLLRLYTIPQLELYIRSCLDRSFDISQYVLEPKAIKLRKSDMKQLIIPKDLKVSGGKKALF